MLAFAIQNLNFGLWWPCRAGLSKGFGGVTVFAKILLVEEAEKKISCLINTSLCGCMYGCKN